MYSYLSDNYGDHIARRGRWFLFCVTGITSLSAHRIARDLPLFLRPRAVWGCCGVCGAAPVAAFRHAGRLGAGKLLRFGVCWRTGAV